MYAIWPAHEDEVSCFSEVSPVVSCHPRREDATLLLPLKASCGLLPALEFICAHGSMVLHPSINPRCSPIRNPWLPNSSLPTPLPQPVQCGLRQVPAEDREQEQPLWGMEPQPGQWETFHYLQTPAHSLPALAALEKPGQGKEKLTSQGWEVLQTLMQTASAGTIREPAGPWRSCRGKKGECPNHPMQRRPSLAAASWLVPTTSACQKGRSPQKVYLALCWFAL